MHSGAFGSISRRNPKMFENRFWPQNGYQSIVKTPNYPKMSKKPKLGPFKKIWFWSKVEKKILKMAALDGKHVYTLKFLCPNRTKNASIWKLFVPNINIRHWFDDLEWFMSPLLPLLFRIGRFGSLAGTADSALKFSNFSLSFLASPSTDVVHPKVKN